MADEAAFGTLRTLTAVADEERSCSLPALRGRPRPARLPTPGAPLVSVDLSLPSLRTSRSLSSLAGHANARQERVQRQLDRALQWERDQGRALLQRGALATSGRQLSAAQGGEVGQLQARFNEICGDVAELLGAAAAWRAEDTTTASREPPPVETEPAKAADDEARKKEERRRRRAEELSQMLAASGPGARNQAHRAVQEKLADLRSDPEARVEFDKYCGSLRQVPPADRIEANIAAIDGASPEAWLALQARQTEVRRARGATRRGAQAAQLEAGRALGAARTARDAERRASLRAAGLVRARVQGLQLSCARWTALLALGHSAAALSAAIAAGRERAARLLRQEAAAALVQRGWRVRLISLRLARLVRGVRALRRGVFWWRWRHRLERKRRAVRVLLAYLASVTSAACSAFSQRIKRFTYQVVKVQRAWRRAALVFGAQQRMVLVCWAASDYRKRGGRHGSAPPPPAGEAREPAAPAALPYEQLERMKAEIAAEDLSRRRREQLRRVAAWEARVEEARRLQALEDMMSAARHLLAARAVTVQRHARGRLAREATRRLVHGAPPPLELRRDASRDAAAERRPELTERPPLFRLLPNAGDIAKLDARFKARQRALLMGAGPGKQ